MVYSNIGVQFINFALNYNSCRFQRRWNISKCSLQGLDCCSSSWIDYYCRGSVKLNMEYSRIIGGYFQPVELGSRSREQGWGGLKVDGWRGEVSGINRADRELSSSSERMRDTLESEERQGWRNQVIIENEVGKTQREIERERDLGIDRKGEESLPCQFSQG